MARIKVRFEINKGRTGAPLSKLGNLAQVAERFLASLALDVRIDTEPGEWLAINFENGSVCYDVELQHEIPQGLVDQFNRGLDALADYDPDTEGLNGLVSERTVGEYARMGTVLDADEVVLIGHYGRGRTKPKLRTITYQRLDRVRRLSENPIESFGSIQCVMEMWRMLANQFAVREISTGELVKCHYRDHLHPAVAAAVKAKRAILHVTGTIFYDRASDKIARLEVEELERAPSLSPEEFNALMGSMPAFTGDQDTEEYLELLRNSG